MSTPNDPGDRPHSGVREASDESLLRLLRDGRSDAARSLYERYAGRLLGLVQAQLSPNLARRIEAEDIVQSVFRTFFRRVGEGDYDVLPGEEYWKLFMVMALNKVRNQAKYHTAARRDVRLELADAGVTLEQLSTDAGAAEGFLRLVVSEALERLPEQYRQVVELRLQEYNIAEIARIIGRSRRSTERLLQEVRARLAELLTPEE